MHRASFYLIVLLSIIALIHVSAPSQLAAQQNNLTNASGAQNQISEGTRFLVGLDDKISTRDDQAGKHFTATTLEPLVTSDGMILPAGAEVHGHISRVEQAQVVGTAKLWLTFDQISTPEGNVPIVAEVADVPGEQSVKTGQEGQIETRTNKSSRDAEAAAAGAAMGAMAAAKTGGAKGAAIAAGVGAMTAFLASSGFGREIELEKDAKLELILYRPIYLASR